MGLPFSERVKTTVTALFILTFSVFGQDSTEEVFIPFGEEGGFGSQEVPAESEINFFEMIPSAPKELEVTNDGGIEYQKASNELVYRNHVIVKGDTGVQMYADEAVVNLNTEKVTLVGNVSVYNGPYLFKGEVAEYYYVERRLDTAYLKTGYDPFLIKAASLNSVSREGKQVLVAKEASVTTDDYQDPSFWLKADVVSVYPDEMVVFKNMKLQIGDTPVFWLPYFAKSLDGNLGYHFTPGGMTHLGMFWKSRYGMHLGGGRDPETHRINDPRYLLSLRVDPYSRRGIGLGADISALKGLKQGEFSRYSFYGIYDNDPEITRTRISRTGLVDSARYGIKLSNRKLFEMPLEHSLRLDTNLHFLSDQFFLEDYFEADYRVNPQPENTVALSHTHRSYVTTLSTRFTPHSFYESDERLPEFTLDRVRSNLWQTPLLYESQSRFGFLRKHLADAERDDLRAEALTAATTRYDEIQNALNEPGFFRGHSWHEFSLPQTFCNGGLSLTPRVGGGYTHYTSEDGDLNHRRFMSHLGLDVTLKLQRSYDEIKNPRLGLNGLSHTIQPYISASLLNVSGLPTDIQGVDTLTALTRPRPIHLGRYSALDDVDDWALLRTGIRQSFRTKRDGGSQEWLYWDTYMDFVLGDEDDANSLSNLYTEVTWNPLPWFRLSVEAQFPVAETANEFSELYSSCSFMLGRSTEVTMGYNFLKNHPVAQDSNRVSYSIYHRLNDEWGLGLRHFWEFDDNTLEQQRYSISRSMKSWIFSSEIFQRNNRVIKEYGVSFGFVLRDFPEISLPLSVTSQ